MANIKQGDNGVIFGFTVKENGVTVDIRNASVVIAFKTDTRRFEKPATVTDGQAGKCEAELTSEDLSEAGFYTFEGIVTFADSKRFTSDSIRELIKSRI